MNARSRCCIFLLLFFHASIFADRNHSRHQGMLQAPIIRSSIPLTIPDISLINQYGESVNIISDVARDKTILLNTIFTTCTTICTPMGAIFASLQKKLSAKIGADVMQDNIALISVSIDPATDTPERLLAWQSKFGSLKDGQGAWTLLTGPQADVEKLLKACGLYAANVEDHSPIALLGNANDEEWQRLSGLTSPDKLARLILEQLNQPTQTDM